MSDPSTLLQATAAVCGVWAMAFWCGVRAFGFSRDAGRDWALANAFFAAGSLLTVLRASAQNPLLFGVADGLELFGFACLLAGFQRSRGRAWPCAESFGLVGLTTAAMLLSYVLELQVLRLAIYCGSAAWLLGHAAWVAHGALRDEFGATASALVAAPMALASALQMVRGGFGLVLDHEVTNCLQPFTFNVLLLWAAFAIALLLNVAIAGFAGARQFAQIRAMNLQDPLTGALNRRAFEKALHRELKAQHRHGMQLSLVYLDLDHFKALNDRLGHAAGDEALRRTADVLAASCREGDLLARMGGEEFCVLLPFTGIEGACLMAERMRGMVEAMTLSWEHEAVPLRASFGVSCSESAGTTAAQLLAEADKAMYEAKKSGRNCVCVASVREGRVPVPAVDECG